jgi:tRNA(Arg) A34 adenosine deaminase TadA
MTTKYNLTAFIYDKQGRVISFGQNSYVKTHPLQAFHARKSGKEKSIYLHAEIHAITRCKDISAAHKMVVVRYGKDGKPAPAKPCVICQSAIKSTPIKIVEHT